MTEQLITRRDALRTGAVGFGALTLAACGASSSSKSGPTTVDMLTWVDHTYPSQLAAVQKQTGITTRLTLGSDDAAMFIKAKESGQFGIVSIDALWAPYFYHQGLTEPFDINSMPVAKQLYSVAREVPFWKAGGGYLAYPRAWSGLRIFYNPKFVSPPPDSYHALLDPKYNGKFVRENQPTDIMAEAGLATGSKDPYNMTPAELDRAKQFLKAAKPAFLKLVPQVTGVVQALANEEAWFTSDNLGIDLKVKDAGGPVIKSVTPKEGVVGWMDSEQKMKGPFAPRFEQWIESWGQAEWIPALFNKYAEPWFNEKAYKLLVNQGKKEVADALLYNKPEEALKAHLKGPSKDPSAYISAFNEVFGA